MYKKLAVFTMLFSIGVAIIYANRGNSLTYNSLSFIVSDEALVPQSLIDDLKNFLSSYYSITVDKSEERVIKYNWKKFLYFENTFIVRKLDIYVKLRMNIQRQQPYLLHRKKITIIIFILVLHGTFMKMKKKKMLFHLLKTWIIRLNSLRKSII